MFGSPIFLWLALFVVFLIVEAGTVALVSIWFALGALAALVSCVLGAEMWLQITVFLVVSLVKTNVDSVIGAEGYVTEAIDNLSYTGRVKLGGITWAARSTSGAGIPVGTLVKVERIEGVKVFVSPAEVACKQ